MAEPSGRAVAELRALPGARIRGEHLHPSLHERFTVVQGELTVVRDGWRSTLHAGECADIEPGTWHDWTARELSDVIVFRRPPPRVQRVVFAALAPIARRRGYRATCPSLSRTTLALRSPHAASG